MQAKINYPDFLVAIDKKRDRVFVLERPHLIAVRIDGVWHYGQGITDEEIDLQYELVTDVQTAKSWIKKAKVELRIP